MSNDRRGDECSANRVGDPANASPSGSPFSEIVSHAQRRSVERREQLRRRYETIAQEQQRRWNDGVVMLNGQVRPLLERALQACVEEGIPAILEDNFGEQAATPRLLFYCSGPQPADGKPAVTPESVRLIVEADGQCIRAGTAKSFSAYAEGMQICSNIGDTVTAMFSDVLESYFQEFERVHVR